MGILQRQGITDDFQRGLSAFQAAFGDFESLGGLLDFGLFFDARQRTIGAVSIEALNNLFDFQDGPAVLQSDKDVCAQAQKACSDSPAPQNSWCRGAVSATVTITVGLGTFAATKNPKTTIIVTGLADVVKEPLQESVCGGGSNVPQADPNPKPPPAALEPFVGPPQFEPPPAPLPAPNGTPAPEGEDDDDDDDGEGGDGQDGDGQDGDDPENGNDDDVDIEDSDEEAMGIWDRDGGDVTDTPSNRSFHKVVVGMPRLSWISRNTNYINPVRADVSDMPRMIETDQGAEVRLDKIKMVVNPVHDEIGGQGNFGPVPKFEKNQDPWVNPVKPRGGLTDLHQAEIWRLLGEGMCRYLLTQGSASNSPGRQTSGATRPKRDRKQ
ncbi:hypothetical protein [Rhizobium leguminosarum]|uniref:hypothetical protein n=1 Tax=Rhizobium leguminosarum TaxID=384 RepID=UPI001440EE7D|nr:hypothetical protein [Rhizobium leguminosarum]NKM92324.1 hypothetical protein [Rhizobium leguminosarum bv. viciae]